MFSIGKSRAIDRCIYCGSKTKKLTTEHIVPYGLNGEWTLKKASCRCCAEITSDFERHALRDIFLSARSSLNLRSRKKDLPNSFRVSVLIDNKKSELVLDAKEHGAVICLLEYKPPAYLENREYSKGIDVIASCLVRANGKDLKELAKEKGFETIRFIVNFKGNDFERFIAKIAYCFSVLQFGLRAFESVYVLPAILGEKDDIGMWLGSIPPSIGQVDIEAKFTINDHKEVIAIIRLFGKLCVPSYTVVVGKLK